MLAAGLLDEVRRLRSQYALSAGLPSMRAVGYRQVWLHLEGELTAAEMRAQAVAATRQLAKRQLTWLRSFRELEPAEKLAHSFL
jgi:tRNA dimethylallyltransferase